MKKTIFSSFEAFEQSGITGDYEHTSIIEYQNRVSADLLTEAKSIEMAVKKFFTSVKTVELFDGWREQALELMSNGVFEVFDRGSYAFEVEEIDDGLFYIMLTVWR